MDQRIQIPDRRIRVFISSTFRDMQAERETLIKRIFPQLRKLCEERAVTWAEVDLRWGITDEQKAEGKVLPLCLEEIHRCRPYFIGLLGERYGHEPDSTSGEFLEAQPWLRQHLQDSVTELEISYGVFGERWSEHAYFYFRDAAYIDGLSPELRQNFTVENPQSAEKLRQLKEKIRLASARQRCTLREGYPDPERLGDWILKDFTGLIDHLYPREQTPDPLDLETARHEAYAGNRRLAFVGREDLLRRLDHHVATAGDPLVLTGESGCGKSALLAEWTARWQREHPDDFIVQHFIGATPDSADWQGLVRRILAELKRAFAITGDLPLQAEAMRDALNEWTARAAGSRRVVLVLDALNQLAEADAARQLGWLPVIFPANFSVLVSALPGESLNALRRRAWPELHVPLFARNDITPAAQAYFRIFGKTPPPEIVTELESAPATCNALYLRTVLDELRQFGKHERLHVKTAEYLAASDLPALFHRILARWREDFGNDLVGMILRYLWAARQGLSEVELLDMLGTRDGPFPRQTWMPCFLAMESHLIQRLGLLTFGHEHLRDAVQSEFLPGEDDRRAAHSTLADYFEERKGMSPRKAAEWPWQLHAAESWARLEHALTDLDLFTALYDEKSKWELTRYWLPLRQLGSDIEADYTRALERAREQGIHDSNLTYALGSFLIENGCFRTGKDLTEKAARSVKVSSALGEWDADYATAQTNLAALLEAQGDFAGAAALRTKVLSVYELAFGEDDRFTATACINLAGSYLLMGRRVEAEPLIRRAIGIDEHIYGNDHPEIATDLVSLAECLRDGGKLGEAEIALKRALTICQRQPSLTHPVQATVLSNLAALLVEADRPEEAEPLAVQAVEVDRACLGSQHPNLAIRLNNLAAVMKANGRIQEALGPAQEALRILVSHSVRAGTPHRHTEAAAVTLASLATEAGLAAPLALHVVNEILRPMQETFGSSEPQESRSKASGPEILRHGQRPAQTETLAPGSATTEGEAIPHQVERGKSPGRYPDHPDSSAEVPTEKDEPEMQAEENEDGIPLLSQLFLQLDRRNVQYRAERGDPRAQCAIAVMLESDGNSEQAVTWYRRSAEQGYAQAQFNLGVHLQNGSGGKRDEAEAVRWYEAAAKQGYLNAMYNLAYMREHGYGCARDLRAAFQLYECAANQKEADSQCKLAILLLDEARQARAGFHTVEAYRVGTRK